jgi:glycosyltransferase involved in cell wall biosynthesis
MIDAGRTGLLVPPDDPAALASSIGTLLDDPALAMRLAREGQRESERYAWPIAREAWRRIYRQVASRSAPLEGV